MVQAVLTVGVLHPLQDDPTEQPKEDITMGELVWKDHFNDWQEAVQILNDLGWNLSWKEHEQRWYLWSGEPLLFVGDTKGEFEAFLCGMGISLAVLPDSILKLIRQIANE
jgi:hypothetical protein